MQCNIDGKGRAVRLVSGIVVALVGLVLLVLWLSGAATQGWMLALSIVTLASGAFQIYEGWSGWCVLRAMGVKTPL